jgi:hypothetical protein
MQYKPIENCQMKNVILRKDFNLAVTGSFFHVFTLEEFEAGYVTGSFFHVFTLEEFEAGYELLTCIKLQKKPQMHD